MIRRTLALVALCMLVTAAVSPSAIAQPGKAGDHLPQEGPGGTDAAEGERGISKALEVVPDFVRGILSSIASWFR